MAGTSYVGKAGQLAVMAELALRGYNVAIPEIDVGDDVFAVNDKNGNLWRIQVKTATAKKEGQLSRFQFRVKRTAITQAVYPDLTFIFVLRDGNRWRFLVIDRPVLNNYIAAGQLGQQQGEYQQMFVTLNENKVVRGSKNADFSHHLGDWSKWPKIG